MALKYNINMYSENVTVATCRVGDRLKICAPVTYLPADTSKNDTYHRNGFTILDEDLGEFEAENIGDMCVYYKHNKSGKQIIQYISQDLSQKVFYLVIDGIVVHDHASIPQGGPAFATYYSETRRREEGS
jgi:hypothetical protein